jgi:hypothetical protein
MTRLKLKREVFYAVSFDALCERGRLAQAVEG